MNLYDILQKPEVYNYGESIWTDAYIAPQMLLAHLDSLTDAASYNVERIHKVQSYLVNRLELVAGKNLIDLGCGPGLYTNYFGKLGVHVTGIDISESSILYAKEQAMKAGVDISYLVSDYRNPFGTNCYNSAMCIYEDYGVMSQKDRIAVLNNVNKALKYDGRFALDVTAASVWDTLSEDSNWYSLGKGFFRPHPHVVIYKRWLYPKEKAYCDAHVVIDDNITVYYTFQTLFTPESISGELKQAGFIVEDILGGLDGTPYDEKSSQIGIIARKVNIV
ncbi:MAG: cyclopropane-fatty-acyl-phospholipid synthase [Anaerocolumna sp.]|nr:cyclopropane-fatty-acyl-phospholipid synthase [Anaerocolumna sp.]